MTRENLRTDSLLTLAARERPEYDTDAPVLSEANDSLLSASEIEEIISEQDSVITQQRYNTELSLNGILY